MKSDKALWGSISILVGAVIAILALIRGAWQSWLLIGVFTLWGLWVVAVLLRPYMQQAKRRRMREQLTKKHLSEGIASPVLPAMGAAETELLLLRHVNHRISAYLRAVYPDVRWEWCEKSPEKLVLAGGTGRIRLYGIPDFDHADVCVDQNAGITCNMLKIVPFQKPEAANRKMRFLPTGSRWTLRSGMRSRAGRFWNPLWQT